jgi:hypothetical protein
MALAVGCHHPPSPVCPDAGAARDPNPYVCDEAHDYRRFQGLAPLSDINALVPRREPTRGQRESLTPGDPLWEFERQPDARCSDEGFLELRFAVPSPGGFSAAPQRLTITIAPGRRLLDPEALARMQRLAVALDEALTLLRTKPCSDRGEPCDLQRSPDPLRYPGDRAQYAVDSEFPRVGLRAWAWRFASGGRRVERVLFTTSDGRFDLEVLVETTDTAADATGALHLIPGLLSEEYDRRYHHDGASGG